MSGRIPRHFIDDLLSRVDIVDLIDRHVPLKKAGTNFVALCPFHSEKTPSFSVNRTKQFFHCFGCGASGNAIGFLMDFNHLDFIEAIEDLASFMGLEVPRESPTSNDKIDKADTSSLYQLMEKVAAYFVNQLRTNLAGKEAVKYLKARGVTDELAHNFMLGYAPDEWQVLSKQFNQDALIRAGMLVSNDNKVYDRFRGRVMFPIRDKRGKTIGFGGRVLDDSLPKYLNSPETPIFHKNHEVYGLYELLKNNSTPAKIVVVEGYLDVIALAGAGINYAVATLGTATSQEHFELLFRFTAHLILCFDGDSAGQNAAWRAVVTAFPTLKAGRQISIMLLPEKHDPDSLIRTEGKDSFINRIKNAQALSSYFFEHFTKDLNLALPENRSKLKTESENLLNKLPTGAFRELMFEELSRLYKRQIVDRETLLAYNQLTKKHRLRTDRLSLPSQIMAMLIQNPAFISLIDAQNIDWEYLDFDGIEKFKEIMNFINATKPANFGVLLECFRNHNDLPIIKKLATTQFLLGEEELKREFLGTLKQLISQAQSDRLNRLLAKDKSEGLTSSEKNLLRKLLTSSSN